MRTPGHDEELALGFCLSEGLRAGRRPARRRPGRERRRGRRARVRPGPARPLVLHLLLLRGLRQGRARGGRRRGGAASRASCAVPAALVGRAARAAARRQAAFAVTGGLHATGLFTPGGELLCLREDVGRHNAMRQGGRLGVPARVCCRSREALLCVSGRLSFELVQKAAVAGCPLLVAVGAPSSLAVELAARPRDHALRLRPRRPRRRLHGAVAHRRPDGRAARRRGLAPVRRRRRRSRGWAADAR